MMADLPVYVRGAVCTYGAVLPSLPDAICKRQPAGCKWTFQYFI